MDKIIYSKRNSKKLPKKIILFIKIAIVITLIAFIFVSVSVKYEVFFAGFTINIINLIFILTIMGLLFGISIIHKIHKLKETISILSLLIDLNYQLHSCSNSPKIARHIANFLKKIFFKSRGVIYLKHPRYNYLENIIIWGGLKHCEKKVYLSKDLIENNAFLTINDRLMKAMPNNIPNHSNYIRFHRFLMDENKILGLIQFEYQKKNKFLNILDWVAKSASLALANLYVVEMLQNKSIHDALTGLYNRNYLNEHLTTQLNLAMRQKKSLSIIMFDIDHFKEFNDDYGHDIGDLLLMAMSALLQEEARMSDAICRYGGEEFIWILYDCSLPDAKDRAEKLRRNVQKISINYKNKNYRTVSISIGLSCFPNHGSNENELIKAADKALYQAKRTGRNKVITYSEINPFSGDEGSRYHA